MAGSLSGVILRADRGGDVNIWVFRGKTLRFDILVGGDGDPMDLTGYQAVLVAKTNGGGAMLTIIGSVEGELGKITFEASPEYTKNVSYGTYEVEIRSPGGDIHRIMSGRISYHEDLT